ncbi:MAG TPA: fibronectin type III domain-containing protein, partial [Patescibacteria group bacterium]|nr:fibronectin type III domain-containing protein [Patescibacteria group bacterium]
MEIESPNKRRFWQLKPGGYHNPKGFTLLEVLIVISILAILTTVGIGYYRNVVKSNEVELAAKSIANDLKVAKAKAIAGEGNLRWGIHFVDGVDDYYEIFSTPTDYNDPAKVVIQTVYLPKGVNLTGTPADIIFDKITGNPLAAAEVVINNEGYTASVEVSALGNLKVNKGPRAKDLPGAPTSLNAVAGLGQVNLTWTAPSQQGTTAINNYKIYRGLTSNSQTFYANAGNTTSYNDTGSGPADQPFGTNGVVTGATASQYAYAMAKDSTYMYVAGSNDSSAWRIEKRLLSTGALDNGFGTSGVVTGPSISYIAYSITIDSTYMYVAGANDNNAWRIEKRLLSTGALDNNFGTSGVITGVTLSAAARAITIDSTYMYVAGYNENADLRIEKRLLSTGALDNGFGTSGVITGASSSNGAYAIAKDSTYMYLGGYNDSFDWRIEKRLLSTGAVDNGFGTSGVITGNFLSSVAYAIAIDSTYMYVAGYNDSFDWRIEKRLLSTGALDSNFGTSGVVTGASLSSAAYSIAIDSTYMYVAGYDGNTDWRIEKRLLSTGAVDNGFGTSGVVTGASLSSTAIPTAIDSTYMYVAGYDGNSDWRIEKRKLSDGALFSPVLGVDGGTTYYYRVSAENTLGEGPQSNVANATPTSSVPAAPTNLVATPGSTQVSLTWTAAFPNGNQITNYKVYQYSSGCTSVLNTYTIGNTTSYTNTGLTNGLGYCYKVSAVNGLGEGAMSSSVTATPAVLPGAPTGLSGTPGNQQVTLNWSAPASDGGSAITNYKIYSSTTAGQETLLTTVGNVLTYDNTSLTGGITYYYKVSAVNPIGEGAQSSETSATPTNQTIPGAPTGLAVTPGTGQLTLNWSAPSSDGGSAITNYKIYRGTSASGETFYSNNASNIAVNTLSPNGSTSSSATSFSLQRKTFYDSSNSKYWAFYNNGTAIAYYNSTTGDGGGGGGSTWTSRGTTGVATSNFAVWYVPGTSTVYLTYLSSGIKVVKGTLGSTSISWGTVYSANADTLANEVSISRDSNGRLWVGAHASNASTNNTYVIRSTNIDDPSAWGATQTILSGTNLNGPMAFNLTMVPMTSANMYFVYEYSPDAVNNFYIKGMKWNDATSSLGSQDAIDTISAVGVADYGTLSSVSDSSGNVYALYETCSTSCKGPVKFAKYTGSWQTPVTIDSNTTNGSLSLSIDTATGDLYGFWIRANTIYYSKGVSPYVGANWTTPASLISTGTNAYLTSGYQAGSNGYIPMIWTEGTGSLYNIKFFGQATPGATGTATSFVDTGVNNGTTYYYKVSAVNVAGEGAQSNEASGSPNSAPGAPTGLAATPGDGQATLNWSAPASNGGSAITNYNVYRGTSANGETLLTTLGNVTNYTDTGPAGFGTGGVITGAAASIASYAIAKDSTYMYVVGQDATPDWRIEKRLLSTGALDPGFGTSGVVTSPAASDIAYAIAIDSTYMYVGGYDSGTLSRIEKRLLTTGALDNSFGTSGVVTGAAASWGVRTIAIDSTYMYIGGLDGNVDWRIEKRLLSTGALDNGFGTSGIVTGVTLTYSIRAITIDSTYMYVAGYDANLDWRIEKRLLTTGAVDNGFGTSGVVTSAAASQYAYAIAKDATYMYVAGQDVTNDWRIEKRLLSTGAVDNAFGTSGVVTSAAASYVAQAISIDASYMYVVGSEGANTGPYDWRIEKRLLSTGAVDNAFGTSGVVTSAAASNIAWAITIDSTNMYVAGDDGADSRIEKRLLTNGNLDTSGLTNGTTYYYKVSAVNAIGEGSQSNEASGTPQAVLNRATFYLQQDDSEVAGCPGCFNTMTLGYPTFAGSDVVNAADTIISYNGSNPCEGTSVNSGTTQIQVDMDGVITEACIAAFYTPVLGTTTTLTTSQTNSISTRFSAGRPSASNNGTVIPKVHLFRYDGASYVEFAILTGTALGTTVASQTVTGTPSINIDIRPTDRIVASYTGNITSGDTSTQTDYFQFNLNDTANPAYVFFQNLSVTTASRPDLTGSKDDDFITYQAETNCTNAGVAYNTKWTCTTPSGTTLGKFKAHHHPSAATIGDATSWLTMEDTEDATLGTNFSASPENTYLWEAVDTNANGNGNISTVINMATRANASMGNPKHHGGLLLWASNTDYLEVQISFDALGQNHVVEVNQNGFLWGTTTLSSNLVWLRWNKVGSIYTPQYSMDGSTWTSIAAGISHPTTFTRTGLTVYTSQTSGHAGAAFEYFDYDLSGSSSIYDQTAYRFYNNVDSSTSVGTPLAANNTPATAPAQGTNFRLRTLLHTTAAISAGNDTFTKLGNPDVLPAGAAQSVCFSPDSKYLAVGVGTSPFITLYKRVGDTFVKLADPTALAGTGWECSWTPDSKYLALGNSNSPFITIYKNNFNDTFTKLGNPSVLPPRPCNDAHFSPDGKYLACTFDTTSPFIYMYRNNNDDTFTKLADLSALAGAGWNTDWSGDGKYVVAGVSSNTTVNVYQNNFNDTFTALPSLTADGQLEGHGYSPDGEYVGGGAGLTPFVNVWKQNKTTGAFTKLSSSAFDFLPPSEGWNGTLSWDG